MRGKSSEENFDDSGVRRATVQAKAALDPKGSSNGVDCLHVHTAGGGDTKFTASGRRH